MKKTLLIIIPARAGSKRVKNKNIRKFRKSKNNQDTLLGIKIKSCLKVKNAKVIVSTESKKIANYAKKLGAAVPFLRNKIYATDKASTFSVVLDVLRNLKKKNIFIPDYIGIMPPTNPLLKSSSIINAFKEILKKKSVNSILSFTKPDDHPFNFIKLNNDKKIEFNIIKYQGKKYSQFERTQDWPDAFVASAALKISKKNFFLNKIKKRSPLINFKTFDMNSCVGYEILKKESLDINNLEDFTILNLKKNA